MYNVMPNLRNLHCLWQFQERRNPVTKFVKLEI